jgi:hypothetical protein
MLFQGVAAIIPQRIQQENPPTTDLQMLLSQARDVAPWRVLSRHSPGRMTLFLDQRR